MACPQRTPATPLTPSPACDRNRVSPTCLFLSDSQTNILVGRHCGFFLQHEAMCFPRPRTTVKELRKVVNIWQSFRFPDYSEIHRRGEGGSVCGWSLGKIHAVNPCSAFRGTERQGQWEPIKIIIKYTVQMIKGISRILMLRIPGCTIWTIIARFYTSVQSFIRDVCKPDVPVTCIGLQDIGENKVPSVCT